MAKRPNDEVASSRAVNVKPIDPRALKSIADALIAFVEELGKEKRPKVLTFPNRVWRSMALGRRTIAYRRPETIEALRQFRKRFHRDAWVDRWSAGFIWDIERNVMADALDDSSGDAVMASLGHATETLDAEPPEYIVVLPITHLYLGEFSLKLADIEVQTITKDRLGAIRQVIYDIIATTPYDEDGKQWHVGDADRITNLLLNRPAAYVTVRGDAKLAKARALKKVAIVVDFLQLAATMYHGYEPVNITVGGDLLTKQPPTLIIAKDGSNVHHETPQTFRTRYEMEATHLSNMRARGFGPLIDAMSKPEEERSELERILLRSMHWIAEAERQGTIENKTTAYVTAIDMFFAKQGEPLTRDITEGTATVLGSTLGERRRILRMMNDFYKVRSGVSHVGDEVTENDIRGLEDLAISFLAKMSAMSPQFEDRDAFRAWLVDQRLKPSDDSPWISVIVRAILHVLEK